MKRNTAKIIIILTFCFLCAGIISFIIVKRSNHSTKEKAADIKGEKEKYHQGNLSQKQEQNGAKVVTGTVLEHINDLENLLGDVIEGDIGDAMDMVWSSWEITCDFSDCNKVAEVVSKLPIVGNMKVPEEQLDQLQSCITEMVFNNGNNDYKIYLNFLRKSGEVVDEFIYNTLRETWIAKGIPEKEVPADPWELLSEDLKKDKEDGLAKSMWKGLVSEGSKIIIFETPTTNLPIGEDLYKVRGAAITYRHLTVPPIRLDTMLENKGKVIMADVLVFIAHDDSMGGVVWPYIIRYWFDPINKLWRPQGAYCFPNSHKECRSYLLY